MDGGKKEASYEYNEDGTIASISFSNGIKVQYTYDEDKNIDVYKRQKIDSALLPEWGGTREFEAEIVVPKGTVLNIGKVAPQTIKSTGTVLKGGADQVLLPQNWPKDWIRSTRKVLN